MIGRGHLANMSAISASMMSVYSFQKIWYQYEHVCTQHSMLQLKGNADKADPLVIHMQVLSGLLIMMKWPKDASLLCTILKSLGTASVE